MRLVNYRSSIGIGFGCEKASQKCLCVEVVQNSKRGIAFSNHTSSPGTYGHLNFVLHKFVSSLCLPSSASPISNHCSQFPRMMEHNMSEAGGIDVGNWEEINDLDESRKGESVDRFIDKMGLLVSDSDENEVKLSEYLRFLVVGDKERRWIEKSGSLGSWLGI